MNNNIAKIRAALEMARDYITSDLASERGAFEGYEGVSRIDEIKADLANNVAALAALAELEKAAAPQFVAGELSDTIARKLWREWFDASGITGVESAHFWLKALRRELGPALGLVTREEMAAQVEGALIEGAMMEPPTSHDELMFIWQESNARKRLDEIGKGMRG